MIVDCHCLLTRIEIGYSRIVLSLEARIFILDKHECTIMILLFVYASEFKLFWKDTQILENSYEFWH